MTVFVCVCVCASVCVSLSFSLWNKVVYFSSFIGLVGLSFQPEGRKKIFKYQEEDSVSTRNCC